MQVRSTSIADLLVIEATIHSDSRGAFSRLFCEEKLKDVLGGRKIVQINHSRTALVGAIRGLHFQHPPCAEMKLVRCLKGRVWDVAVDLRAYSPTFLQWHAFELNPENANMLVIPEGFAHGFQVLEEDSELLYLHTKFYTPEAEGGILYNDPRLAISWPKPLTDISLRDTQHSALTTDFHGVQL